jgi:hypothetical protein
MMVPGYATAVIARVLVSARYCEEVLDHLAPGPGLPPPSSCQNAGGNLFLGTPVKSLKSSSTKKRS